MMEQIMYLVERVGHMPYTTMSATVAEHIKATEGATVTPIFSALKS